MQPTLHGSLYYFRVIESYWSLWRERVT